MKNEIDSGKKTFVISVVLLVVSIAVRELAWNQAYVETPAVHTASNPTATDAIKLSLAFLMLSFLEYESCSCN